MPMLADWRVWVESILTKGHERGLLSFYLLFAVLWYEIRKLAKGRNLSLPSFSESDIEELQLGLLLRTIVRRLRAIKSSNFFLVGGQTHVRGICL